MKNRELWMFLFALGVLLFNWPFLSIFTTSLTYYLFFTWGLFIAAMAVFNIFLSKKQDR